MTAAVRRKKRKDEIKVSIAPFRNLEDYKTCEDIQKEVWHCQDIDVVPVPMLLEIHRTGGIVLGAYSSLGDLIGFICSILGSRNGAAIQHSCMLAVRMATAISTSVSTQDRPAEGGLEAESEADHLLLRSHAAAQRLFALGKLGAWSNVYEENYWGETTILTDRGMPTDRLLTCWDLEAGSVMKRLEAGPPRHDLRKELKRQPIINHLMETAPGLMNSSSVKMHCAEDHFLFEVPYNLPEIKNRDLEWRWNGSRKCARPSGIISKKAMSRTISS